MTINRLNAWRDVRRDATPDGALYERIGLAVADYLEARRLGHFEAIDDYVARFPGHEETARACFEAAELLGDLELPDRWSS